MKVVENQTHDEERAFYGCSGVHLMNCAFDGIKDGESALKECKNIIAEKCFCNLRYPFWHDNCLEIKDSTLTDKCRAAIWYSDNIEIINTKLHGIKALRECKNIRLYECDIISPEFGWNCSNIDIKKTNAEGEYFFMRCSNMEMSEFTLKGKYSFQYIKNGFFDNCTFDTKDAFWHAENVTVRNSVVKGEYLAWYSDGLTLINCTIKGTQPFCYCKNLKLINCTMENCDLAFEKSDVDADIIGNVLSIKNPLSGSITVDSVDEIIRDDGLYKGKVILRNKYYRASMK